MTLEIFIFYVLALLAEIVGTISGFGSSLFFVPIAIYFFDFYSALGITAVFHIVSNINKIYFFKKGIDWSIVMKFGIPATFAVLLGSLLTTKFNPFLLKLILGIFLVLLSSLLFLKPNIKLRPNLTNSILGGSLSGFMAGIVGTGGAIRGISLLSFGLLPEVYIASSAIIDLAVDVTRAISYYANGYIHGHDYKLFLPLFVIAIVGTYIGKTIVLKINQQNFRNIVLLFIFLIGIYEIYNSLIR